MTISSTVAKFSLKINHYLFIVSFPIIAAANSLLFTLFCTFFLHSSKLRFLASAFRFALIARNVIHLVQLHLQKEQAVFHGSTKNYITTTSTWFSPSRNFSQVTTSHIDWCLVLSIELVPNHKPCIAQNF